MLALAYVIIIMLITIYEVTELVQMSHTGNHSIP